MSYPIQLKSYLSLQSSDLQAVQDLSGLVTVTNILERLGGILTGNVQQDFLTTTRLKAMSAVTADDICS